MQVEGRLSDSQVPKVLRTWVLVPRAPLVPEQYTPKYSSPNSSLPVTLNSSVGWLVVSIWMKLTLLGVEPRLLS